VKRFGFAAAAVIGLLEFLDRAQPRPSMPLASRARIVAELEGVVGKNAVDQALKTLVDAGVIRKIKSVTPGQKNLTVSVEYALCPESLSPFSRDSRNRESREVPISGPESGTPSINKIEEEKEAEVHAAAAAPQQINPPATGKRRRRRESGIVTWIPDDEVAAERLESNSSPDDLARAVQSVMCYGKDPVPGLVSRELERLLRRREAETAVQERRAAASAPPADPEDAARGRASLESRRRLRRAAEAP